MISSTSSLAPGAQFDSSDSEESKYLYDSSMFWLRNKKGDYVSLNQGQFETYLKMNGKSAIVDKSAGEDVSEVDREVQRVIIEERVDFVGPLAGWRKGLHEYNNTRLLITRELPLLPTAEGEWPTLAAFLEGLLVHRKTGEDGKPGEIIVDQRPYLHGWLQHALVALYSGEPVNGLAMVLAGEAGCGKTLLKEFIRIMLGGKESYPYAYMSGRDNFNRSLTESVLWTVDDERSNTHTLERLKFGDEIKKLVASRGMNIRGMHKESLTLNPLRRLVICVNNEPEKLMILPPLDDDIHDKITILRCSRFDFPMPVRTEAEKRAFFSKIESELAAYTHHLLTEWTLPDEMYGRFGCIHFQHPEIQQELLDVGPEADLLTYIDKVLFGDGYARTEWEGATSELYSKLTDEENNLTKSERYNVPKSNWMGKRLKRLQKIHPNRVKDKGRTSSSSIWWIGRPENEAGTTDHMPQYSEDYNEPV